MISAIDHVQLAIPAGSETELRAFYCDLLALPEIPKPAPLQGRGGFWVQAGDLQVHFGVDPSFIPARKAHPAFCVHLIDAVASRLRQAGHAIQWDESLPDVTRFFAKDPVGNRLEFIATNGTASQALDR